MCPPRPVWKREAWLRGWEQARVALESQLRLPEVPR
jgi:ribosome modulation factor